MAMIQLLFWFGIVMLGLGLGIGAMYWFSIRQDEAKQAPQWRPDAAPRHGEGA